MNTKAIGSVAAIGFKIGPKILSIIAKFAKVGKVAKVGLAAGSVAVYSHIWTWEFGVSIVAMLFVHEFGHITAMKKCGMKVKGIFFIPMVGAAAVSTDAFKTRRDEAYIAIMGPIYGIGFCLACVAIYQITGNPLWGAIAGVSAFINLFNLLPAEPLDGGRILKSCMISVNSKLGFVYVIITGMLLLYGAIVWEIMILWFLLVIDILAYGVSLIFILYINRKIEWRLLDRLDEINTLALSENQKPIDGLDDVVADIHNKFLGYTWHLNQVENFHIDHEEDEDGTIRILPKIYLDKSCTTQKPVMTHAQIGKYVFGFFAVAIILLTIMVQLQTIPEVKMATGILVDRAEYQID